jgi:dinuclear metal center YbgI/SA1388 family protein
MSSLTSLIETLECIAPPELSEGWDNIGLLLGDSSIRVTRVLTCLTLTEDVADEAIAGNFELIVTHHPILFRSVKRITAGDPQGAMLLKLIRAGVAVYSPHTSYDNSEVGINRQLSEMLEMVEVEPLRKIVGSSESGAGRWGKRFAKTSRPLDSIIDTLEAAVENSDDRLGGARLKGRFGRVGIACGSAAEFLDDAQLRRVANCSLPARRGFTIV